MPLTLKGRSNDLHPSHPSELVKRIVLLAATAFGLFAALDFSTSQLTLQAAPQRKVARTQTVVAPVSVSDCMFLKNPEEFREAQARHRITVSRTTQAFSESVRPTASALVSPQEIPRKNFIDAILFDRMSRDGINSAPLCSDAEFIRRVTLDLTGRIPSPEVVTQFLADTTPDKRELLVDALAQTPEYIDKWTQFFGDLYRNSAFATNINIYRGGRDAFYYYIKDAIGSNRGYDQITTDLIAGNGDSFNPAEGYANFIVLGNVPMGPAQDTMDGLAVKVSGTFLGVNAMDCLLCHDGRGHLDEVNLWGSKRKRSEAWGMSAFFARTARRSVQLGSPPTTNYVKYLVSENATGEYNLNTNYGNRQTRSAVNGKTTTAPEYMFGGGGVLAGESRRQALARHVINDPQFARATVNYIWEKLMIEGLVSPSSAFDLARLDPNAQMPEGWTLQPANAELLEAMAQDFKQKGFDLRYLISAIAKSSAYQLSSQYAGEWKLEYLPYFARKYVRRLDAEESHDAVIKATGIMPTMAFGGQPSQIGYVITNDLNQEVWRTPWAMQLPEPVEPRSNGTARAFLDSFLRGDRDQKPRALDATVMQSLNLMNNSFVMGRIHRNNTGSLVSRLIANTSLTNEQIIEQLYLTTLSRQPTANEVKKLLPYYTSLGKQVATESVQWVLLNKVDFMFNY
ncbi:MAG: DUF1549 domain-containing protein [Blastocatellia bacterium]|nr:DUF1549 domain-containing protein [Blastocatellia bacterium]